MRVFHRIENPDKVEVSLTITATVKELREIRDELSRKHPSWVLASAITDVVHDANRVFRSDVEEASDD